MLVLLLHTVKKFNILNFIYFTTITKQVIQLILIMPVGTDVCVWIDFVWETHLPDLVTNDHLTCRRWVSNPGRSGERQVR